jgi:hypothetical protein
MPRIAIAAICVLAFMEETAAAFTWLQMERRKVCSGRNVLSGKRRWHQM